MNLDLHQEHSESFLAEKECSAEHAPDRSTCTSVFGDYIIRFTAFRKRRCQHLKITKRSVDILRKMVFKISEEKRARN